MIFSWSGGDPNKVFLQTNGMWHDLSIIFNEIFLSNKFSLEPQHYLEDSYISIFALIYTLELLELQLLKYSLANRFCLFYWRHRIGHLNDIQCLKLSPLKYVWRTRHGKVAMHWNGGLVEARHHHESRVLSAQRTYATNFFLKLWYESIV